MESDVPLLPQLMADWRRIGGGIKDSRLEAHLERALPDFLTEDWPSAAIRIGETPTIVALAGFALVEITVAEQPSAVHVATRPIVSERATLALTETMPPPGTFRLRRWRFDLGNGVEREWETRQRLVGGFQDELAASREEQLARMLAAAIGWTVPARVEQDGGPG